ncbi:MAG: hypothetical protein NVSMB17_11550 [Candidatus Dormibacteria bacterium]
MLPALQAPGHLLRGAPVLVGAGGIEVLALEQEFADPGPSRQRRRRLQGRMSRGCPAHLPTIKGMATCPDCSAEVTDASPQLGEILVCTGCGADLEVISQDPLTLEVYEQEEK